MFSKNNIKMNDKKQAEKINQYGIKKFNAGTASGNSPQNLDKFWRAIYYEINR